MHDTWDNTLKTSILISPIRLENSESKIGSGFSVVTLFEPPLAKRFDASLPRGKASSYIDSMGYTLADTRAPTSQFLKLSSCK